MPAYIVKFRKPAEEIRVKNKSFYKIRVTKSSDHSNSSYIICEGKNTKFTTSKFITKCVKFPNGKVGSPLTPVSTNDNSGGHKRVLCNSGLVDCDSNNNNRNGAYNNNRNGAYNNNNNRNGAYNNNTSSFEDKEILRIKQSFLDDFDVKDHCLEEDILATPTLRLNEPKICQVIHHSRAKKVDDVIEEILNLEEGFESGNGLKKSDSQLQHQQSQGEVVPGTVCDLLGLNGFMGVKSSSSCPPDVPKIKTESSANNEQHVVANMKDRQKKDNHNMIERRRRFTINDRIRDLMHLLPKAHERYHDNYRDTRHNKGQILTASVSYMKRLKEDVKLQVVLEEKVKTLEQDNKFIAIRLKELENLLRINGIEVEETKLDQSMYITSFTNTDVMSPTSTKASSTTSPYTPTPTTSPFTLTTASPTTSPYAPTPTTSPFTVTHTTSPMTPVVGNFTSSACNNEPDRIETDSTDLAFCDEPPSITPEETTNLLNNLAFCNSNDAKKAKTDQFSDDFLLKELLMGDFPGNFGLNLMDDDNLTLTSDPLLSSPQMSSPANSSRHSFDDALTPDSMDIAS